MGKWIKRKADEHRHDMPKSKSDAGMNNVFSGDIWECSCKGRFKFMGWDTGTQWDSYPAVAKWVPVATGPIYGGGGYDR